jgi:3-oxoacyl-(acyl-carrier-protein) synthase
MEFEAGSYYRNRDNQSYRKQHTGIFRQSGAGKSGADWITRFDASLFKTRFACEIKGYSPEKFGLDKKESRRNDLFTQYALVASDEAIRDSHLTSMRWTKIVRALLLDPGLEGWKPFLKKSRTIVMAVMSLALVLF